MMSSGETTAKYYSAAEPATVNLTALSHFYENFVKDRFIENLQRIHWLSYTKYYRTRALLPLGATETMKARHGILRTAVASP